MHGMNLSGRCPAAAMSLMIVSALAAGAVSAAERPKFIGTGWDLSLRTPGQLLAESDKIAATGLDGISINVPSVKNAAGKTFTTHHTMTAAFFTKEEADRYVPVFRGLTGKKGLRHSFILCHWSPVLGNRLDWRDDAAWAAFASNMRAIAYLARKGGLEGIIVDPEDYSMKGQFVRAAGDPPIPETWRLARRRGREIGRAVFEEFPSVRLLMYWALEMEKCYFDSPDPRAAAATLGALYPPFFDGLFDVIPPEARIVSGDEWGYGYKTARRDHEKSVAGRLTKIAGLLAPESLAKYRAQTSFGFGCYIDPVLRKPKQPLPPGETLPPPLERLLANLDGAARETDEYVWVYGEKHLWCEWKDFRCHGWQKINRTTWESVLPGLSAEFARLKNPPAWARATADRLKAGKAENLIASKLVKPETWQSDKGPKGTFRSDPGAGIGGSALLTAEGVRAGCFIPSVYGLKPGEEIIVEAYVRGNGALTVRWTKNGVWQWSRGGVIAAADDPDADGWRRMCVLAKVDSDSDGVRLKLDARDMPGGKTEFSGVAVWRLPAKPGASK